MPDPGPSYPPQPTPSARREHQSSGSRSTRSKGNPAVESAVTRLLVSIKSLLESLTHWSELKLTENDVSDVYVRLGNDFNAAVSAFAAFNIDMSELMSVPDDLRGVLEECLSEEANSANLNKFLPTVRSIITNLLQGLRTKQSLYRRVVSDGKHKSSGSTSGSGHERTDSRASRTTDRQTSSRQPQRNATDTEARKRAASSSRTSRRKDSVGAPLPPPPPAQPDDQFVGGFNLGFSASPGPDGPRAPPIRTSEPPTPAQYPISIPHGTNSYPPAIAPSPIDGRLPTPQALTTVPHLPLEREPTPPPPPPTQQAPASMKRYSLVDRPISSPPAETPAGPSVVVYAPSAEDIIPRESTTSPSPETPPLDAVATPAMASSLAALKKSDTLLERRASKRFSIYHISKMTGGGGRNVVPSVSGSDGPSNRKSMAVGATLTQGDLAVLTEADEADDGEGEQQSPARSRSRGASPFHPPPVPPLPPAARDARAASPQQTRTNGHVEHPYIPPPLVAPAEPPGRPTGPFSVFLQVGREVKKVTMDPNLSLSSLRMLFLDRFSYNPGKENFPAIYIRDPSSGVQYELEDMEEVKERCLLSLNIEPLDQIKQHIDVQMASLSQEIKDLRTTVSTTHRNSIPPSFTSQSFVESTPPPPRPTDKQLAHVARRLSRFVHPEETPRAPLFPQMTGQSLLPQMTGASVMSEYTNRVVSDLRTQFDEVQNLRRDIGIMRQMYTEFMQSTKESLGGLRSQTQAVRQLAGAKVGGARAYIDAGKTTVDSRSQDALTRMEELQDVVEGIKDDVLKRHITPNPSVLSSIKADVDNLQAELDSLTQHISTVKPMWKKTWEEELQNIVEEQQFLHHQEEFLADLLEDYKAVVEVYGHVEKVISIRGTGSGRVKGRTPFRPPPAEDSGGEIDNVMMEIRNAAIDPDRRMKAIAANQRSREKELASRSDEFERELSGFVGGKKLKMTGGAEEAERVRQKRNDMTLKAMFTGSSASGVTTPSGTGSRPGTPSGASAKGADDA